MTLARIEDAGDRLIVWNMNAARRGALSVELYEVITEACARAAAEPRLRSVILASEGGYFCAGGDMNTLITRRALTEAERIVKIGELQDVARAIRACPVPVIAAVQGGAAGAGLSLALACDLIVAEAGASFVAAYVRIGLVPDGGMTAFAAQALPRQLVTEMCLLGRPVGVDRMAALGVVSVVAAEGAALAEAQALADAFAKGPRDSRAAIKALIGSAYGDEHDQLEAERAAMARAQGGDEAGEGIQAFLDKRKPSFP
ncbi:oxepin-CoA hydrolase, alternative type [Mesobacterium pallidum]|uniref:oxepin-CoA hydrolase, alternative type n=1 Tax=Mesobacterium pallidum TaxID=2872037 RepID=UPI001EE39267|nr:enoyl-CoA hydratase family protein [Mesobacterium pallidum]